MEIRTRLLDLYQGCVQSGLDVSLNLWVKGGEEFFSFSKTKPQSHFVQRWTERSSQTADRNWRRRKRIAELSSAGSRKVGTPQAGFHEARNPQAGSREAGTPQAGSHEAGTPQAGSHEAGTPQAGSHEAGTPEANIFGGRTPGVGSFRVVTHGVGSSKARAHGAGSPGIETDRAGSIAAGTPGGGSSRVGTHEGGLSRAVTDGAGSSRAGTHETSSPGIEANRGSKAAGTQGTGFPGRMKLRSKSRIEELPSSPIPQLDGEHAHPEPLDPKEEEEVHIGWNYPGPRRGRLVKLKQELQRTWPDCETFHITFDNGNSLNELTLGCSCSESKLL